MDASKPPVTNASQNADAVDASAFANFSIKPPKQLSFQDDAKSPESLNDLNNLVHQLADDSSESNAESEISEGRPEVVIIEPAVEVADEQPVASEQQGNDQQPSGQDDLLDSDAAPMVGGINPAQLRDEVGTWISVSEFSQAAETEAESSEEPLWTRFAIDPYALGDGEPDSIPVMASIPTLDDLAPASLVAKVAKSQEAKSSPRDDESSEQDDETPNLFFATPGEVLFIDGCLGYDNIDLRCFTVNQATFQNDMILVEQNDADPISIRHRGIRFAVFSGEVMVDL